VLRTLPTSLRVCVGVGVGRDISPSQVWGFFACDSRQCPKYQSGLMLEDSSPLHVTTNLCRTVAYQAVLEKVTVRKTLSLARIQSFALLSKVVDSTAESQEK
jgi:hypothetical protein